MTNLLRERATRDAFKFEIVFQPIEKLCGRLRQLQVNLPIINMQFSSDVEPRGFRGKDRICAGLHMSTTSQLSPGRSEDSLVIDGFPINPALAAPAGYKNFLK